MLGDHRGVVVAATCQMRDQVFVRKFLGVDRLELSVSLERGRLDLFIPVVKLLSPELPLEDIFDTLEALRYVAFRDRPHRLVGEAVDVLVLERVDKHPVKACEVLNTAPQCLGMELCPVTRHGSRKVDRIEFPRAGAGRFEAKLHCLLPSSCCSMDLLLAVKFWPGNSGRDTDIAEGPILILGIPPYLPVLPSSRPFRPWHRRSGWRSVQSTSATPARSNAVSRPSRDPRKAV